MDTEGQIIIDKKSQKLRRKDIIELTELIERNYDNQNKKLYFFIFIVILINFGIIFYIYINKKEQKDNVGDKRIESNLKNEIKIKILNFEEKLILLENKINNLKLKDNKGINYDSKNKNEENIINNTNIEGEELPEISYEKFDENIYQEVKKQQMEFCNNQNTSFLNKNFNMYVYNQPDYVSNSISNGQSWEFTETKTLIDALNYYSSLKNIPNDNIYILDIGANVGWYTFSLANCGYQVLSFEASVVNNYILKKNFCLNPNLNIG